MATDIETLTSLYVEIDEVAGTRWMGRPPRLADSELVCLAVAQALLGYHSEARWLRFARKHLADLFFLPAPAVRIQQATARRTAPGQAHDPGTGRGQRAAS